MSWKEWLGAKPDADDPESTAEASPGEAPEGGFRESVIAALREVYDPEIPVNIYDLGLVYRIDIDDEANVAIEMTLTAPGCPVAQEFPSWVETEVMQVPGVKSAHVEIVWDPPWTPDQMTDEVKLELGML